MELVLTVEAELRLAKWKMGCWSREEGLKVFCDGKRWVYAARAARQSLLFTLVDCFLKLP